MGRQAGLFQIPILRPVFGITKADNVDPQVFSSDHEPAQELHTARRVAKTPVAAATLLVEYLHIQTMNGHLKERGSCNKDP